MCNLHQRHFINWLLSRVPIVDSVSHEILQTQIVQGYCCNENAFCNEIVTMDSVGAFGMDYFHQSIKYLFEKQGHILYHWHFETILDFSFSFFRRIPVLVSYVDNYFEKVKNTKQ